MQEKKRNTVVKAVGSVILAIIASSHHWLHTLLIALGLTSLGAGLLSLPPYVRIVFLVFSLIVSVWFLSVSRRKWHKDRPAAWVYLISSIISIIVIATSIPQMITDFDPIPQQQEQVDHEGHHRK